MVSTPRTQVSSERARQVEQDPDPGGETMEPNPDDDEFKITVKKLDIAVRPRGVLAE